MAALEMLGLSVAYQRANRVVPVLHQVSLTLAPGESCGLVGESGSGKSTLALAALRALPPEAKLLAGQVRIAGRDMFALDSNELRQTWRNAVHLVPQNAAGALNPSLRIGGQVIECLDATLPTNAAYQQALELLRRVRLPEPERVAHSYPHQLSGGMQQRVLIAMALAGTPPLLILDEPTTGLDTTTEAAILDLLGEQIRSQGQATLFISHNLGVVARFCQQVAVLYAGELVEHATAQQLFTRPLHPYTHGLIASLPLPGATRSQRPLAPIPGRLPPPGTTPTGCIFAPRCPLALAHCHTERPAPVEVTPNHTVRCHRHADVAAGALDTPATLYPAVPLIAHSTTPLLTIQQLSKRYQLRNSFMHLLRRQAPAQIRALDAVSLQIRPATTLGVVGESGSGKTTLVRCVIGLEERDTGTVSLLDLPLPRGLLGRDRATLRRLQMVFQNPEEALNPFMRVGTTLRRPLMRLAGYNRTAANAAVVRLLVAVKLDPAYANRFPSQLSGGEKQRVAIARAFASEPQLILCDEPTSALDLSVQAAILNLLDDLRRERGTTYLLISHDLGVVSYLTDTIAVVYLGKVVEVGPTQAVLNPPFHPYTEALIAAAPRIPATDLDPALRLTGEPPGGTQVPSGCPFHTRCPRIVGEVCRSTLPPWREAAPGHLIRCHIEGVRGVTGVRG